MTLSSELSEPTPAPILEGWAADGSARIVAPTAQRVALIALAPIMPLQVS